MRTRSEAKREREKDKPEFTFDVPNDPVNEQVVLAAMVVDADVRKRLVKLPADAFYAPQHKAVFLGLQELERRALDYDPATIARLHPEADIRVLETLAIARPEVPTNLDFHVSTLHWDLQRAQLANGSLARLVEAVQNPKETPERIRALARSVGESFEQAEGTARFLRKPGEVVHEAMTALRRRVAGEAFYPFGIEGLDFNEAGERRLRPGAAPGLVTILTGMSGAGKTTTAAHMILGIARQRRRVLVGAWEVRAPMTLELLATLSLKWSRTKVLDGKLTEEELGILEQRMFEISKYVTFVENPFRRGSVEEGRRVSNADYLNILEAHIEASGCDVVLLDLFDRVLRDRTPNDEQEAIWTVLEFTNALQIHTVLVHQQLVKGEGVRADKIPSIQGLKGSSAYVDAGALILAPHLPARFKKMDDNKMWMFGLKQRFGPPFAVEFDWHPESGQLSGCRDMPHDGGGDQGETGVIAINPAKGKFKGRGR